MKGQSHTEIRYLQYVYLTNNIDMNNVQKSPVTQY